MFNRKRTCKNPDCRKIFDPISPHANCCCKSCNNRVTYLIGKAKKLGLPLELIWTYVILHSLYDQRRITQDGDVLEEMGVNFKAFPAPVSFNNEDNTSVLPAGNLGLILVKDKIFRIVKKPTQKKSK